MMFPPSPFPGSTSTFLRITLPLLIACFCAGSGYAGVVWTLAYYSPSNQKIRPFPSETVTYAEENKVRIEHWDVSGGTRTLVRVSITRMDQDLVWLIDPRTGEYDETTKHVAHQKSAQFDAEGSRMDAMAWDAYAKLTPEQKIEVDTAYEKEGLGSVMNPKFEMPKTTYTPTGQRWKTKWGFCEVYEGWRQKKKISEVCFADGDRVVPGLREADLGIKRYAAEFNGGQAGAAARKRLDEEIKPGGKKTFSLKTIVYHHGTPVRVTEVTEARQESLAPALFELPTNLKKR